MIKAYVEYLLAKLGFHQRHSEFTGNFDYEEYLSLKGASNLDEGYQTVIELMDLQAKLDVFQRLIFDQFRPSAHNECRIAALVPMIEESYGIYKFTTSMLTALHMCVDSPDPFCPLVERYNTSFWALKEFYDESKKLRYLTSLVNIPTLPDTPPVFTIDGAEPGFRHPFGDSSKRVKSPISEKKSTPEPIEVVEVKRPLSADLLGDLEGSSSSALRSLSGSSNNMSSVLETTHTTVVAVPDQNTLYALQQAQQANASMQAELQAAVWRHQQDQSMLEQCHRELIVLQQRFSQVQIEFEQQQHQYKAQLLASAKPVSCQHEPIIKNLEEQVKYWSDKYEGMAQLYKNLRQEHLAILSKLKDMSTKTKTPPPQEFIVVKSPNTSEPGPTSLLAEELLKASQAIEAAAARLAAMKIDPLAKHGPVHLALMDQAAQMTSAIGNLIKRAIETQQEILLHGKHSGLSEEAFYKQNSVWTNGLISAAQAVATATLMLVETADGVIKGTHSLEQLVVASNGVAAATAQLVTASRVKAVPQSVAQPLLEIAAKAVSDVNRHLVDSVYSQTYKSDLAANEYVDAPSTVSAQKVREMNKQVEILELEKNLELARRDLSMLRKSSYAKDASDLNEEEITESSEKKEESSGLVAAEFSLLN